MVIVIIIILMSKSGFKDEVLLVDSWGCEACHH
jgi:hypothetical protein